MVLRNIQKHMFCRKCGAESHGEIKFCTQCGTLFSVAHNAETISSQKSIHTTAKKEPWKIGQVIKTSLIVLFVGGVFLLRFGWGVVTSIDNTAVEKNNNAQKVYQSGGNIDQAINQLKEASEDAVTNATKLNTKINLAYIYSSEGKDDLALNTFKEALVFTNKDSFYYFLISGEIALYEKKPDIALIAFNKAYEMSPNEFQINNAFNLFYLDLADENPKYTDYPKALKFALKAYEIQPDEITKQNLAIAYYFNENYKQSISLFSSLNVSSQPYLAYWLGLAYAEDQQPVDAKRFLQIAIDGGVEVPQEVMDYIKNN
jgi:tetratricopeptide (TPR) repeat protein